MVPVLRPDEMYALERHFFEAGNDSLALMERAAALEGVVDVKIISGQ